MLVIYMFVFWSPGHLPFALYLAATVLIVTGAALRMVRSQWRPVPELLLFGLGDSLAFAALASLLSIVTAHNPWQPAVAGALFVLLFLYLIRAVRRNPLGRIVAAIP